MQQWPNDIWGAALEGGECTYAIQVSDSPVITSTCHRGGDAPPGESDSGTSLDVSTTLPSGRTMEYCNITEPLDGISLDVNTNAAHDKGYNQVQRDVSH